MSLRLILLHPLLAILLLSACTHPPTSTPVPFRNTQQPSPSPTFTPTLTATVPSPTPTPILPQTLVFYGDSSLKVGMVGQQAKVGFSFVDYLPDKLDPHYTLIIANYGGRGAQWGYEHMEENVLANEPDVVTLWWSLNDLQGCPGIFDPQTNTLLQPKLDARIALHIKYMRLQIDTLLAQNIPVYVVTAIPVLGKLPWSHFDENGQLVWEENHWCDYNLGVTQLVAAQRALVEEYDGNQPVYLVDAWKVYQEHQNSEKMYMDIVHPGSNGAALIAEEWLRVFQATHR